KKSTAGKQVSSRRVSASTTAPSAPSASSSHMNQNRCWPGVPNMYSTRSSLMVMRPKSSATVVVPLASTPERSSTPRLASVITSSVRSGATSLTEPTMVVLPAPKPPAIRILIAAGMRSSSAAEARGSESLDAIEYRLQYVPVHRALGRVGGAGEDVSPADEVAEQHLDHRDRDVQVRGDLCDGLGAPAQLQDADLLRFQRHLVHLGAGGDHDADHVQPDPVGALPALGEDVGADDRTDAVGVQPRVVGLGHEWPPLSGGSIGGAAVPRSRVEEPPHLFDEDVHLVGDQTDVGALLGQHREAGALARPGDEQVGPLHLHDGLQHLAAVELLPGAAGQALEGGCDRGELFGVVLAEVRRVAQQESVGGQDDRVLGPHGALDEAV